MGNAAKAVSLVTFANIKKSYSYSIMFLDLMIYKFNWTSPDGKRYKNTEHILIGRVWNSNELGVKNDQSEQLP
jgi:hypothetical protein